MESQRFDRWTRRLGRLSTRRDAARAGAVGMAATALRAVAAPRVVNGAEAAARDFVVIRRYAVVGGPLEARQGLAAGYGPLLSRQPGFRAFVVFGGGTDVISVTRFASREQEAAATSALAAWAARWLTPLLAVPVETLAGEAFARIVAAADCPPVGAEPSLPPLPVCRVPGEPGRGCPCHTAVPSPCAVGTLLCCPNDPAATSGEGICVPDRLGCNPTGHPSPTQTAG